MWYLIQYPLNNNSCTIILLIVGPILHRLKASIKYRSREDVKKLPRYQCVTRSSI